MKTHFLFIEQPIPQNCWPEFAIALCGKEVKNPRAVMTIDVQLGILEATSTLLVCEPCALKALSSRPKEVRWCYGILPAEEAHRANLLNHVED